MVMSTQRASSREEPAEPRHGEDLLPRAPDYPAHPTADAIDSDESVEPTETADTAAPQSDDEFEVNVTGEDAEHFARAAESFDPAPSSAPADVYPGAAPRANWKLITLVTILGGFFLVLLLVLIVLAIPIAIVIVLYRMVRGWFKGHGRYSEAADPGRRNVRVVHPGPGGG
ncbi:hypothetical protein BH11PLA1_BH11PLA1_19940 [soil metagenome]